MWKRSVFVSLLLAAMVMAAWASMGAQAVPGQEMLQATYPPPGPTIEITVVVGSTPAATAVTPSAPPTSSTVIIGLLVIILLAVVIGGMALMNRGQSS